MHSRGWLSRMAAQCLNRSLSAPFRPFTDSLFTSPHCLSNRTTIRYSLSSLRCTDQRFCRFSSLVGADSSQHSSSSASVIARNNSTRTDTMATSASPNLGADVNKGNEEQQLSKPMVEVRDDVELTEMEERIFAILTATLEHFGLKTQLRVAGGWVRDKLLGKNSIDIDIALDDMLGRTFCEKVNEYLKTKGEETHTVGVIQSNPEQSKHLETANMRLLGMSIDFVNLRAETYTENSRIPEMEFGTPEQDAVRRDLTINSLFYNINARMVEDLTRQGIADLKSGIIRTPLPPDTTFLDDPLRVCRAIRFGARFDFKLTEELKRAAASEAVITALGNKVSRDRIGHEIELMLMGNQPAKAMQHVEELQLFSAVFRVSQDLEPDPPIMENYGRLCVHALEVTTEIVTNLRYASKLNIPVSTHIILDSLKLKTKDASAVEALHVTALKFKPLIKDLLHSDLLSEPVKNSMHREDSKVASLMKYRVELGLLLTSSNLKELWQGSLLLASIMELPSLQSEGASVVALSSDNQTWIEEKVEICNAVEEIVIKLGLSNVWELKPLLGGKEIMAALNIEQGMQVQEWKVKAWHWQLAHPNSKADECKEWLLEEKVKRLKSG